MFGIFKKRPTIEFWPMWPGLDQTAPVVPAKDVLPEWWKEIPYKEKVNHIDDYPVNDGTIKRCPGVMDLLQEGWVMLMWCDVYVKVNGYESITVKPSASKYKFNIHPRWQLLDLLPEKAAKKYYCILKPESPWFARTSPGYSVLQLDPFYHFNPNFDIAPGIQYQDVYFNTNPQLLIKRDGEFMIPKGTPISVFLPFKREKIKGVVKPYSEKEILKLQINDEFISTSTFSASKVYNKQKIKQGKCPFHS